MGLRSLCRGVAIVIAMGLAGCVLDVGSFARTEPLREKIVLGDSGPKIAMIEVHGLISDSQRSSPIGISRPSLVSRISESLALAADDDDVAALLVRIRSPGGTVSASETLYYELLQWQEETGRPAVAYLDGLAASGGYYLAMATDEIVAHPTTITGSIGVIMSGVNVSGLMERFGIEDQTFTSGDYKDAGSPFREMRLEEREHFEAIVDDLHSRFQEVVVLGRPELDPRSVEALADGRIFTASQALELGLVDRIGHLDAAVRATEELANLSESRLIVYHRPAEYRDNVYTRAGQPPVQVVDIDVLSFLPSPPEPGFYYLWPPALATR